MLKKRAEKQRYFSGLGWMGITACFFASFAAAKGSSDSVASFRNDVMPVLSKAGCNAGACHGNASGKAGFKLSLRGEDAQFDYNVLTREAFGRRVNALEPERSLILLKPTAQIAHEGGQRFKPDSQEYKTLVEWIRGGLKNDLESAPKLASLKVTPPEQILFAPTNELQLRVTGKFSDGSERDLRSVAVYESANSLATISHDGLAQLSAAGETTILVRFLDQQSAVRLALVPQRPNFKWRAPTEVNYIDTHVFRKLRELRMNPSQVCSDEIFLRRVSLDLLGILPTAEEARAFLADKHRVKRQRLVNQMLERPEFADFWALKWSDLLRNEERALDRKGSEAYHHWVRQSLAENKPLDQFVREIISARGSTYQNPAANFYRANRDPVSRAESIAQLFLGTRLQCAQCHNHPFDRWTQDDYYNWASLFARVQYKVLENRRQDKNDSHEFKGEQIVYVASKGEIKNPKTGKAAEPRFLKIGNASANSTFSSPSPLPSPAGRGRTDGSVSEPNDPLVSLAEWITSPENKAFARSQANRIWFHLIGRGIVDPIDDFRPTNPASHPQLLDELARDFVEHKFDVRYLIRLITSSATYQLSSSPNDTNGEDESNFSHGLVRRLAAEQLLDCQSQVLGVPVKFDGYPLGVRAMQIPAAHSERKRGEGKRGSGGSEQFLEVFGKPPRLLTCECERSNDTSMGQAFQLISGPAINSMLAEKKNRLAGLLDSGKSNRQIVEELYWSTLTRAPSKAELEKALSLLQGSKERRMVLEDLAWAMLNSKEFVLRR